MDKLLELRVLSGQEPEWFEPSTEQLAFLTQKDATLGSYIAKIGKLRRQIYPRLFPALIHCIIGQQISSKAQHSIWQNFCATFGDLTAAQIANLQLGQIKACGISLRKANYIQGIAAKFANGELREESLRQMTDADLAATLTKLPGVGQWTVEMLLIFTFKRPNILSFGDLGIRRGLCLLHGHEKLTRELFDYYHQLYSPHATIAGFYLWDLAGQKF